MPLKKYQKTNIFDIDNAQTLNGYITNDGYFSFYQTNGVICIPITNGATYDISGIVRVNASTAIKYATFSSIPIVDTMSIRYGTFAQSETLSITAGTNENYILIMFCGDSDYSAYGSVQNAFTINCANMQVKTLQWTDIPYRRYETATDAVTNLPVEIFTDGQPVSSYTIKGNTSTSGTPSPSNPITIEGVGEETANLFSGWTFGKSLDASTGAETISGNGAVSDYIAVDFNTNPTYTIKPIYIGFNSFVAAYNSSNQFLGRTAATARSSVTLYSTSFPSGTPQGTGDIAYIRITCYKTGSQTEDIHDIETINTMAYVGTEDIPYEPYGFKISILKDLQALTPIYLNEPLMKIGNISDEVNSDGTVTRRIGKIDLGTRTYSRTSSGNFYFSSALSNVRIINNGKTGNGLCTHFVEVTPQTYASTPYSFCTCINEIAVACFNGTGFEGYTTEQFKEAMQGVIMYYVLATPTTETVTAPSIPTTEGANTITVDTTVQPSEFTATWTGWHDSSVKEYDGSQWQ